MGVCLFFFYLSNVGMKCKIVKITFQILTTRYYFNTDCQLVNILHYATLITKFEKKMHIRLILCLLYEIYLQLTDHHDMF